VLKSPCTTVCRLLKKWNSRVSPTAAWVESGANVKRPLPTLILMVSAAARATVAARRVMDGCIAIIEERRF